MIGAWMVKGPEALKGYGTRAANGVLSIRVQTYPYTESWSPADPSLWDPEDLELYLVWEGDELPEQFEMCIRDRSKRPGIAGNPSRFPNVVTSLPEVVRKVDERWVEYGLGERLESPSDRYRALLLSDKAAW